MKKFSLLVHLLFCMLACAGNPAVHNESAGYLPDGGKGSELADIITGAERTDIYFPILKGKRIAFAGNHTSLLGRIHMVDTLLGGGFNIVRVFSPEHGFRGTAAAGEWVESGKDPITGLQIISLYGSNRRPSPEQLEGVDVIVFDIQDVGVRFYTYISTMTYLMEAAAKLGISVVVLDRPNPIGHYVDGPMMEPGHASFVGLHPVPVVHGMTIGEYALMANGEGWLDGGLKCDLRVIGMKHYDHSRLYTLPVAPSPNLPNMRAIYLYPSLCFFEGTAISVGRGTDHPFQVFGHPALNAAGYDYRFTPQSLTAAPNPPELGNLCFGTDLRTVPLGELENSSQIQLNFLLRAYQDFEPKEQFFNAYFERLAGTDSLRSQIVAGFEEQRIRASWAKGIEDFKRIRSKYLLYPDFE